MRVTTLQLHKRSSYEFNFIQDKFAIDMTKGIFALADGTTQSFKSEKWAEIITKGFVVNPTFNVKELVKHFTNSVNQFKTSDFKFSSNPAKASLERTKIAKGGTATFLGLKITNNTQLDIINCGDTNLFIYNKSKKLISYPYESIDELDSNVSFINSEQLLQGKIDESSFKSKSIKLNSDDILILATDALSRLFLKSNKSLADFLELKDFNAFHSFCLDYWEKKELEEDDISAIIIDLKKEQREINIEPPLDFAFPREKEVAFIPNTSPNKSSINISTVQMQEINNQFNGVANDFINVKKKLKFHNFLLFAIIILLLVNIAIVFLNRPNKNIKKSANKELVNKGKLQLEKANSKLSNEIKSLKKEIEVLTSEHENQVIIEEKSDSINK